MIRFLFLIIVFVAVVAGFAWYSAQTLPSWYAEDQVRQDQVMQQLSDEIEQQGVGQFLGSKIGDVLRGKLSLNETEFNALLLTSLRSTEDGRKLLSVCDAVNADLQDNRIELGLVVDLDKVAQLDAKARQAVAQIKDAFPLLADSQIFIGIAGKPIARDGNLAFTDNISLKLGSIPISNSLLKQFGVPVEKVATESITLDYMSIQSVAVSDKELTLGVRPRF